MAKVESSCLTDAGLDRLLHVVKEAISKEETAVVAQTFADDNWRTRNMARSDTGADAFALCAKEGNIVTIRQLLRLGADPNSAFIDGQPALSAAAFAGHVDVVEELLRQKDAQVNARGDDGFTPLHAAAGSFYSNLEVLDLLLRAGGKISARNKWNAMPVHCAAQAGNLIILRRLLEVGSNVNAKNISGHCPFVVAGVSGQLEAMKCIMIHKPQILRNRKDLSALLFDMTIIPVSQKICKTLLDLGARIDFVDKNSGMTCLHVAAYLGFRHLVALYLRQLPAPRALCMRDLKNFTPLALACMRNHFEVAVYLIRHGAPLDGVRQVRAPLLYAVNVENYRLCRKLLLGGAKSNPMDDDLLFPLELAARTGNTKLCRLLVAENADLNNSVEGIVAPRPLLRAVEAGNIETAKYLIRSGSSHRTCNLPTYLLVNAVRTFRSSSLPKNWKNILSFILKMAGADINGRDGDGFTALHEARDPDVARFLIEQGADLEARSKEGATPLIQATSNDLLKVCKVLLAAGAHIDSRHRRAWRRTPLLIAVLNSNLRMVSLFLKHNASLDVTDCSGRNVITYAVASDQPSEVVSHLTSMLLAMGGRQVPDNLGYYPVHFAAGHGHVLALQHLVEAGGDPDVGNAIGKTALHTVAKNSNWPMIIELCRGHAVNQNCVDKFGCTPLHVASTALNLSAILALLAYGANVNCADHGGRTPLMVACSAEKVSVEDENEKTRLSALAAVNCLMENGANIAARTKRGLTALHFAAVSGKPDIVLALLLRGSRINAQTKKGRTPLHCAARSNMSNVISILASRGAALDAEDGRGRTALHEAVRRGHFACARLMISLGARMDVLPFHLLEPISFVGANLKAVDVLPSWSLTKNNFSRQKPTVCDDVKVEAIETIDDVGRSYTSQAHSTQHSSQHSVGLNCALDYDNFSEQTCKGRLKQEDVELCDAYIVRDEVASRRGGRTLHRPG